jgi:hypothetical protein
MGRGLSLLFLLVPLVMGGWLLNAQMSGSSGGQSAIHQIDAARQAALDARFQQAAVHPRAIPRRPRHLRRRDRRRLRRGTRG